MNQRVICSAAMFLVLQFGFERTAIAREPPPILIPEAKADAKNGDPSATPKPAPGESIPKPSGSMDNQTLGGMQFWGDELCYRQWRIQRNVISGHCRLLDGENLRLISGSFNACNEKLEEIKKQLELAPMRGRVVILLHGLFSNRTSMSSMQSYLEKEGGFQVLNVSYPSTRTQLGDHAASLARVVSHLEEVDEIDFVAHSLGNLVVRHYLFDQTNPEKGLQPDPRIKRIVMLGPPNNGAQRAALWADNKYFADAYKLLLGTTGKQLATQLGEISGHLATPACEFGILAGGRGDGEGWHAKLAGDDDGTVTVEETRLVGAHDFLVLPLRHDELKRDPKAMECTLRFLKEGYFVSAEARVPLLATK